MDRLRWLLEWEWYGDTSVVRLYLHLLLKAKTKDEEWQGISIPKGSLLTTVPKLSDETGLSVKQVRRALKILIEGTKVGTMRARKMTIITICEFDSYDTFEKRPGHDEGTIQGTMRARTKEQEEELPPAPLLEEEKEKEKNKKKILSKDNIKEKVKEESFVAPEFSQAFSLWLEYKKEKKQSYKGEVSLRACYNKLVKLANGDPDTALAIVEQSMANNWAGLFALKNESNGQKTTYINDPVAKRNYERCKRLQAVATRAAALAANDREPGEPIL